MSGSGESQKPENTYRLRLFVAGNTPRSQMAIENLRQICDAHLANRIDLEVIDIYQQPEFAGEYQIIAAPTLLKMLPLPVRRIVGDLSETERVLRGLEITRLPPENHEP